MNKAIAQYQKLNVTTAVDSATPHQLVEMLFNGANARIRKARGCAQHGDIEGRNEAISSTLSILSGLQASLDHEQGGDLSANLDALYDYMQLRLFRANTDNDVAALDEVSDLLDVLREAWGAIAPGLPSLAHG